MKQHITIEQLNELTENQKQKLYDWNHNRYSHFGRVDYCLLSIGQMIEFLDKDISLMRTTSGHWHIGEYEENSMSVNLELCDVLWEVVKEILEK